MESRGYARVSVVPLIPAYRRDTESGRSHESELALCVASRVLARGVPTRVPDVCQRPPERSGPDHPVSSRVRQNRLNCSRIPCAISLGW